MLQPFIYRNLDFKINNDIENFLKNFQVYKKIDFNTDIDKEKSGEYIVNNKNNELTFMCDSCESIFNYKGHFLNDKNGVLEQDKVKFIPNVFCSINKFYNSYYFSELEQKDDYILYFDYRDILLNESQMFRVSISNLDTSIYTHNVINNLNYEETFKQDILLILLEQDKTKLSVIDSKNDSLNRFYYYKEKSNNHKYSLLDAKDSIIFYNTEQYNFGNISLKRDKKYVGIWYLTLNKDKEFNIKRSSVSIGKKKGFIYLKPFYTQFNFKILIFSKGRIELEYYSQVTNKWIDFSSLGKTKNINMEIRIKLSSLDRIKGIYFVK